MLSESSWVNIGTIILMALITAVMRLKAKSDKADMKAEIDNRVKPLEAKVNVLTTDQIISQNNYIGISQSLNEIKDLIKEKDSKNTDNFNRIYEKLDTKQDK